MLTNAKCEGVVKIHLHAHLVQLCFAQSSWQGLVKMVLPDTQNLWNSFIYL